MHEKTLQPLRSLFAGPVLCAMALLVVMAACKKQGELIEAKLLVKEAGSGLPVNGAKVLVYETDEGQEGSVNISGSPYAICYSNSLGEAPMSFKTTKGKTYSALVSCAGYYNNLQSKGGLLLLEKGRKNYATEAELYAVAYVKLRLRNTAPVNTGDAIALQGCGSYTFTGMSVDTTIHYCADCSCKYFGNYAYANQTYTVTKGGVSTAKAFSFFTTAHDTVTVGIDY